MPTAAAPDDVLQFWFHEIRPSRRFNGDKAFDQEIRERFGALLRAASRCELAAWRTGPEGRLAEIIVLDQFSRNVFRGTAGAFANDPIALCLAQEAVLRGVDQALALERRAFIYMPFMHSESRLIQATSVSLFAAAKLEDNLNYAMRHKEIIDRFDRFPHRNAALGRPSTPDEAAFLQTAGARFSSGGPPAPPVATPP